MLIYQFQPYSLQVLLQIWCQSPLQQLKHWSLYSGPENKSIVKSTITMHTCFINIIFLKTLFFSFQFTANLNRKYSSVQFSRSFMSDSVTPRTTGRQASLSITNSWSLLKLMSIELVMPS